MKEPRSLFKFRAFGPHTLDLLCNETAHYAAPSTFNDPLDCSPPLIVDSDRKTLEELLHAFHGPKDGTATIRRCRYAATEYGATNSALWTNVYLKELEIAVKAAFEAELLQNRVLSMASRWDSPLMWSHYADQHRGLCIQYDLRNNDCRELKPVRYGGPRAITTSDLAAWKIQQSQKAEANVRETFFYAKAAQWRYEREWRDLQKNDACDGAPFRIKAVYFGIRCDHCTQTCIIKLLCDQGRGVVFYRVCAHPKRFALVRQEVDLAEMAACGVNTSERLLVRDCFN